MLTSGDVCGILTKLSPRGAQRCTLKIEQCKKKLMQIRTKKGNFKKSRETLEILLRAKKASIDLITGNRV